MGQDVSRVDGGSTDRIDKEIVLRAPRERVWRAISDSQEFGAWFGIAFEGPFVAGQSVWGRLVEPARLARMKLEFVIGRIEPERLLSLRWHPAVCDVADDYSQEAMTTVTFTLEDAPGGTRLRVSETGFDALPGARGADAFRLNGEGWAEQLTRVEKYVAQDS